MATRCAERISERRTRQADSLLRVGAEGRDFLSQAVHCAAQARLAQDGVGPWTQLGTYLAFFLFFFLVFEAGFLCIDLGVLELTLYTRLATFYF